MPLAERVTIARRHHHRQDCPRQYRTDHGRYDHDAPRRYPPALTVAGVVGFCLFAWALAAHILHILF